MASTRIRRLNLEFNSKPFLPDTHSTNLLPPTPARYPRYLGQTNPVTGISSRTFAIWTLLSGIIRLYAAYDVYNPTYVSSSLPCSFVQIVYHSNVDLWSRVDTLCK